MNETKNKNLPTTLTKKNKNPLMNQKQKLFNQGQQHPGPRRNRHRSAFQEHLGQYADQQPDHLAGRLPEGELQGVEDPADDQPGKKPQGAIDAVLA